MLFQIIGALGLLLIAAGVVIKRRMAEDVLYIGGGVFLEIYSIHIGDPVFIILQMVFIAAALEDLLRLCFKKNTT